MQYCSNGEVPVSGLSDDLFGALYFDETTAAEAGVANVSYQVLVEG